MEKPMSSWKWTLVTQLSLCFALFIAFYIGGDSNRSKFNTMRTIGSPFDLYFLSVRGGFRPLQLQTHLLKQMEKVAKTYDVKFVVNISELGENDPLMQNGTKRFPSLKVPWYTTNALQVQGKRYILKKFLLQHGRTLDLIVVDTTSGGYLPEGKSNNNESDHLHWLTRTLEMTDSDWRVVVGYDPMLVCYKNGDKMGIKLEYESLYRIFTKFGVNAYLSKQPCTNLYLREGNLAHIGNLGPADEPYFSSESSIITRDMHNGFFLHKVGPLEIVSYFINPASEVVFRSTLHQQVFLVAKKCQREIQKSNLIALQQVEALLLL